MSMSIVMPSSSAVGLLFAEEFTEKKTTQKKADHEDDAHEENVISDEILYTEEKLNEIVRKKVDDEVQKAILECNNKNEIEKDVYKKENNDFILSIFDKINKEIDKKLDYYALSVAKSLCGGFLNLFPQMISENSDLLPIKIMEHVFPMIKKSGKIEIYAQEDNVNKFKIFFDIVSQDLNFVFMSDQSLSKADFRISWPDGAVERDVAKTLELVKKDLF